MYHPKIDGGIYQCIHSFKPNQLIEKMYNSEAVHGKWHFYGETLSGNWDVTSFRLHPIPTHTHKQKHPQTPNYPPLTLLPVWLLALVIWLQQKTIVEEKVVKVKRCFFLSFPPNNCYTILGFRQITKPWLHSVGFHRSTNLLHISNKRYLCLMKLILRQKVQEIWFI